jgi:transglutaminase-like putative cysteine protease
MRFSERGSRDDLPRRRFLKLAGYGGLGIVTANWASGALANEVLNPASITEMAFDVSYKTRLIDYPSDAEDVHIWMPLPPVEKGQDIQDLEITCPLPYEITTAGPYGNRLVHVETRTLEPFSLEARYHVVRHRLGPVAEHLDESAKGKYRQLTPRVQVGDAVAAFADKAIGDATRPIDIGRRVYDAIIDALVYDKQIPGCGTGDTAWIMRHRRGKCDDYHALFMAVMISRGVPVRWEQGFPLPYPKTKGAAVEGRLVGDCSGAHCWASFYDPDAGWIPVDVSEGDKNPEMRDFFFGQLTPNRFKVSEGRAIRLSPEQGGDPLETFAFAYAESDGLPLIYDANYENVIQFTVTGVKTA